jgi:hypothetical protein
MFIIGLVAPFYRQVVGMKILLQRYTKEMCIESK